MSERAIALVACCSIHVPARMIQVVERGYEPHHRMAPHAHLWPTMSLVLAGTFEERRGSRSEVARPLSVSLMGADIEHEDRFGSFGARMLSVRFESDWTSEPDAQLHTPREWRWIQGGLATGVMLQLFAAARNNEPIATIEQLVVDALVGASTDAAAIDTRRPPAWLLRVRSAIDDTKDWPPVDALARIGGVHRVHLAREFRRYFGSSVSGYIRRRSVQWAMHRMSTSRATLSAIAHEAGFADHAHMCHAFRQHAGHTPSALRALLVAKARDHVTAEPTA